VRLRVLHRGRVLEEGVLEGKVWRWILSLTRDRVEERVLQEDGKGWSNKGRV
jgi:hypothetical protein